MEKSIKKLINYILIILVIGLCIYLGYNFGKKAPSSGSGEYQVVQFSSGEFYYGKLQLFPCCKMKDIYIIQNSSSSGDEENNGTQLVPFTSMFFSPENAIYFDRSQLIWWANLSSDSQIIKAIDSLKNPKNSTQEDQSQQQSPEASQENQNDQNIPQNSENSQTTQPSQ